MARCFFCPRQATESLNGVYSVCEYCKKAFNEGLGTGMVLESERKRLNPRKIQRGRNVQ